MECESYAQPALLNLVFNGRIKRGGLKAGERKLSEKKKKKKLRENRKFRDYVERTGRRGENSSIKE